MSLPDCRMLAHLAAKMPWEGAQTKGPARLPARGPMVWLIRRLARGSRGTRARATRIGDCVGVWQVGQQRRLWAEYGRQSVVAADLVAPCRRGGRHAADADGAEELAVNHDGKRAGIGEIALPGDASF